MGREERAEKLRVPVRTCSSKTCSTCCSRDLVAMSASPAAICASMRAAKSAVPWSGALAGATCGGVRPRSAAGSTMSSATAESAASIAQRRPGRHVPVTPIRSMLPGHASQQPLTRHGNRSAPGADALGLICIVASGERRAATVLHPAQLASCCLREAPAPRASGAPCEENFHAARPCVPAHRTRRRRGRTDGTRAAAATCLLARGCEAVRPPARDFLPRTREEPDRSHQSCGSPTGSPPAGATAARAALHPSLRTSIHFWKYASEQTSLPAQSHGAGRLRPAAAGPATGDALPLAAP